MISETQYGIDARTRRETMQDRIAFAGGLVNAAALLTLGAAVGNMPSPDAGLRGLSIPLLIFLTGLAFSGGALFCAFKVAQINEAIGVFIDQLTEIIASNGRLEERIYPPAVDMEHLKVIHGSEAAVHVELRRVWAARKAEATNAITQNNKQAAKIGQDYSKKLAVEKRWLKGLNWSNGSSLLLFFAGFVWICLGQLELDPEPTKQEPAKCVVAVSVVTPPAAAPRPRAARKAAPKRQCPADSPVASRPEG